jgi:hypothetical protein
VRVVRRALALLSLATMGCSGTLETTIVDAAMTSAHRPRAAVDLPPIGRYDVLAGDLHCHVRPPDHPLHATRDIAQTIDLADEEGLDFVVLTPHVNARFFADAGERAWTVDTHRALQRAIAKKKPRAIFVAGMEYTDHRFGHVGLAFADLDAVLADVPLDAGRNDPALFFRRWVARGGFITLNHPLVTPVESLVPMARADLSWRPFTRPGPMPPEIAAAHALAGGLEAFNLTATHLRDRFLVGDSEHTIKATMALIDRESARGRRVAPVGGSDSHSFHLRPTTYVLAESRDAQGIRDALVAGRTCIRAPEACTFMAHPIEGGPVALVGGDLPASRVVVVRAAADMEIFVDGKAWGTVPAGKAAELEIEREACTVLRARVGRGWSAPIHVNCKDLTRPTGARAPVRSPL